MQALVEGLIGTGAGDAFVETRGKGPPVIVVHGGPGFDHEPLRDGLAALARSRRLVFFDQLACGRTPAPRGTVDAEATFRHAAAVIEVLAEGPVGLVAHSWGVLVAAQALALRPNLAFTEALFINPVPLDAEGYATMRAALEAKIPAEVAAEVQRRILAGEDAVAAFALLAPSYVGSPKAVLPRMGVSAMTYVTVHGSLGPFDATASLARFGRIKVIRGERDFVGPRLIRPILDAAADDVIVPGVGHYPFFEDRPAFDRAIGRFVA